MEARMFNSKRFGRNVIVFIIAFIFTNRMRAEGSTLHQQLSGTNHAGVDPIFNYVLCAGIFLTTLFVLSYFKRKEEKAQAKKRNRGCKQAHFGRYAQHRGKESPIV